MAPLSKGAWAICSRLQVLVVMFPVPPLADDVTPVPTVARMTLHMTQHGSGMQCMPWTASSCSVCCRSSEGAVALVPIYWGTQSQQAQWESTSG